MTNSHNHPTADEVYANINTEHPHISRATVYRNLNELAEDGKIARIKIPGGADRYDNFIHNHHHAYCRCCHKLFDINASTENNNSIEVNGFKIEKCHVTYEGLCLECMCNLDINK